MKSPNKINWDPQHADSATLHLIQNTRLKLQESRKIGSGKYR